MQSFCWTHSKQIEPPLSVASHWLLPVQLEVFRDRVKICHTPWQVFVHTDLLPSVPLRPVQVQLRRWELPCTSGDILDVTRFKCTQNCRSILPSVELAAFRVIFHTSDGQGARRSDSCHLRNFCAQDWAPDECDAAASSNMTTTAIMSVLVAHDHERP